MTEQEKIQVFDKFTYTKRPQESYDYCFRGEGLRRNSDALLRERYIYRYGEPVAVRTEGAGELRVESGETVTRALDSFLPGGHGAVEAVVHATKAGAFAVTFRKKGGAEYMLHAAVAEGETVLRFSLDRAGKDFVPDTVLFDYAAVNEEEPAALRVVSLRFCSALDYFGRRSGQAGFYTAKNSVLTESFDGRNVLCWTAEAGGTLTSPVFPDQNNTVYNMVMPRRNTVFMVLRNSSGARELLFSYKTWEKDEFCEVSVPIEPHSDAKAYYINLAGTAGCRGRLKQFRIRSREAAQIEILRYSFEQEKAPAVYAGRVTGCRADRTSVTVTGELYDSPDFRAKKLSLYATTMADDRETAQGKQLLCEKEVSGAGAFRLEGIPMQNGETTLLPYQLLLIATAEDGTARCVGERFYIENYLDFQAVKYPAEIPDRQCYAEDFGARGDAFTDDTKAIQAAIDEMAAAGGGRVILRGDDSFYGRRYIATSLLMREKTELFLEPGAILWQSQIVEEYDYWPELGHDGVMGNINWTHNLLINNLPFIQAHNCEHIRIRGGKLRMMDIGSEEGVGMPGYSTGCPDRIHIVPIGFFNVRHAEFADFEIVRSNNYHFGVYTSEYLEFRNLRMHEVKCVSGDGFGLGSGTHNVMINRCFFQSNDDGVVLSANSSDPRGVLWYRSPGIYRPCATKKIETVHSYLNSGGGKAIAFITWGSLAYDQRNAEISDIYAEDNILSSVNPVGTWPDNPYNGKQPFDNTETDDWSPVRAIRILHNRYIGNCTLGPIHPTSVLTDCGIHSHSTFVNGDFSWRGGACWTVEGEAGTKPQAKGDKECGYVRGGRLYEGLYLPGGTHTVLAALAAEGERPSGRLFAERIADGRRLAEAEILPGRTVLMLQFTTEDAEDVNVGIENDGPEEVLASLFTLETEYDPEAARERRIRQFRDAVGETLQIGADAVFSEERGVYMATPETGDCCLMASKETRGDFSFTVSVRVMRWEGEGEGYGFFFGAGGENGTEGDGCRLFFDHTNRRLTLSLVRGGTETVLYCRENFFFTSDDYHIFTLTLNAENLGISVDTGKLDDVTLPCAVSGRVGFYTKKCRVRVNKAELR